jgi:6-phosphofructokinase 1
VPKTIDNDVSGTVTTFGFDTAVNTALEAIDRLHTTAESHDRVIVMEVMGRDSGFIALHSGLAGTADVILIPEIPYDIHRVCEKIMARDRPDGISRSSSSQRARTRRADRFRSSGESLPGQAKRVGGLCEPWPVKFSELRARKRDRSCSAICSAVECRRATIGCWRLDSGVRRSVRSPTSGGDTWSRFNRRTS